MKDDISKKTNIFTFMGKDYDCQLNMYAIKEIGKNYEHGIETVLSRFDSLEVVFDVIAILMNATIVKENIENHTDNPLFTADYVASKLMPEDMLRITRCIATAFGLNLEEEKDELDEIMDAEGIHSPNLPETDGTST